MGTLVGHVLPGFGFFVIGLWHLINHSLLHAKNPNNYTAGMWFPTSKTRHLELYLMMFGSSASIFMELFGRPAKHQPLDLDGTIPTDHLHNFEHASISLSIFIYAIFAIILDKVKPHAEYPLLLYIGSIAFAQDLLLFHLRSTDHMGIQGQHHWLLQLVIAVCLITTILGIHYKKSFINSFVRSVSIMFQGIWMFLMGIVLWIPKFTFKGCYLSYEEGHYIERCLDDKSLQRAKAIANHQFCWFLTGVVIFSIVLYLALMGPNIFSYTSLLLMSLGIEFFSYAAF
ncbi:Protein of unknown function DUF716 [Dillenia turbinata]|uniref:Transmembrane protein 45A-like n=1 Tax=Dillenia turbinata TaxID=194707 RepID=A0AAN8V1F1_9MAGN